MQYTCTWQLALVLVYLINTLSHAISITYTEPYVLPGDNNYYVLDIHVA